MKFLFVPLVWICVQAWVFAATFQLPEMLDEAAWDSVLSSVSVENIRSNIEMLASEDFAGRKFGTPGGKAAAEFVLKTLKSYGYENAQLQEIPETAYAGFGAGQNVVAVWDGPEGAECSENHRYIILCAHYDHIGVSRDGRHFPGADDNASGTATLLELARLFREFPYAMRDTSLVFLFADGEEMGFFGSRYWVEHPTVPRERIALALALDMEGALDEVQGLYLFGCRTGEGFDEWFDLGSEKVPELRIRKPFGELPLSDHFAFYRTGIPAVLAVTRYDFPIHTLEDTPDKLNYPGMVSITRFLFRTVFLMGSCTDPAEIVTFRPDWKQDKFQSGHGEDAMEGFFQKGTGS